MSAPLQSAEEMEALIAKALQRWRAAEIPNSMLAQAIVLAIQAEVLRTKKDIISTLARSFKGAA